MEGLPSAHAQAVAKADAFACADASTQLKICPSTPWMSETLLSHVFVLLYLKMHVYVVGEIARIY